MKANTTTIFVLLLFMTLGTYGQKAGKQTQSYHHNREGNVVFSDTRLDLSSETVSNDVLKAIIARHSVKLSEFGEFKLKSIKQTKGGHHYRFEQYHKGTLVYGGLLYAKVVDGNITFSRAEHFDDKAWDVNPHDSVTSATEESWNSLKDKYPEGVKHQSQWVIVNLHNSNKAILAEQKIIEGIDKPIFDQYLLDTDQQIVHYMDMKRYYAPIDTPVIVHIFNPSPTTTAHVPYGGTYVDNNDADHPDLEAEVQQDTVTADWNGTKFNLTNNFVKLKVPVESNTANFDYSRAHTNFEDVNAFYHITRQHQHMDSLGYGNILKGASKMNIDTDVTTSDQSSFVYSSMKIFFGTGGVDDAEDAEVSVHEYGHGISYELNEDELPIDERESIDESLCDYIAVSYTRVIDDYAWELVFDWDGHNEFWEGRIANSEDTYDDYNPGRTIHVNGEFFTAANMQIWEEIGKDTMDMLIYEMLASLGNTTTYPEAAQLVLEADSVLFNSIHHCIIKHYYGLRKLMPMPDTPAVVTLDPDVYLCPEESIQLDPDVQGSGTLTYQWIPGTELSDSNIRDPFVAPTATRTYKFRVTGDTGCFAQKVVTVHVNDYSVGVADGEREICFGDTAFLSATGGTEYSWSPRNLVDDFTSANPAGLPPSSTVFTVRVTIDGDCPYEDTVSVDVNSCGSQITVVNSANWMTGDGPIYIVLPEDQAEVSVLVYDGIGRLLNVDVQYNTNAAVVDPQYYSAGMYFIRVLTDTYDHTTKAVKMH